MSPFSLLKRILELNAPFGQLYKRLSASSFVAAEAITATIFGYDVFISYSWRDGRSYALELKRQLDHRYRVFLDDSELHSGVSLQTSLGRALKRSSALVVIVTEGALNSPHVQDELRAFNRDDKPLIPININYQLQRDHKGLQVVARTGPPDIVDILGRRIWVDELGDGLVAGPSEQTISQLTKSFVAIRRGRLRLFFASTAALVFAAIAGVALYQRELAKSQRDRITAQYLAGSALARVETNPELSLLLSGAAADVAANEATYSAMLHAIGPQGRAIGYSSLSIQPISSIGFVSSNRILAIDESGSARYFKFDPDGALTKIDTHSDPVIPSPPELDITKPIAFSLIPHSHFIIGSQRSGLRTSTHASIAIWDASATMARPQRIVDIPGGFFNIMANPPRLLRAEGRVIHVETLNSSDRTTISLPTLGRLSGALTVAERGSIAAAVFEVAGAESLIVWDHELGRVVTQIPLKADDPIMELGVNSKGTVVAALRASGMFNLWGALDGKLLDLVVPRPGSRIE